MFTEVLSRPPQIRECETLAKLVRRRGLLRIATGAHIRLDAIPIQQHELGADVSPPGELSH